MWLDMIPKVPSHYCRKSTNRLYIESTFKSKSHMYRVYQDWCKENNQSSAFKKIFIKILVQKKISIHIPRKDQCDICCGYDLKLVERDVYLEHCKKKDAARTEKIV